MKTERRIKPVEIHWVFVSLTVFVVIVFEVVTVPFKELEIEILLKVWVVATPFWISIPELNMIKAIEKTITLPTTPKIIDRSTSEMMIRRKPTTRRNTKIEKSMN